MTTDNAITAVVVAFLAVAVLLVALSVRQVDVQYKAYDDECRAIGGVTLLTDSPSRLSRRYHCVKVLR